MSEYYLSLNKRDKVLRLASYVASFYGNVKGSKEYLNVALHLSNVRVVSRLFDGFPFLVLAKRFVTLKLKEKSWNLQDCLELLEYLINASYYPVEHFAWISDYTLLPIKNSAGAWKIGTVLWACSLVLSILKHLHLLLLKNEDKKESQNTYILWILRDTCDLLNAIHWLPPGFLWSSKLPEVLSSICGVISSYVYLATS